MEVAVSGISSTLTDEEMHTLVMSLVTARGERGATEEEMQQVIGWAHQVRIDELLLELVLEEKALINVVDGEVMFTKA